MVSKVRFPIRLKLLIVLGGMALAATAVYLALAIKTFREDKRALVFELTSGAVKTLAGQIQSDFMRYREQGRALVQAAKAGQSAFEPFDRSKEWIGYSVFKAEGGSFRSVMSEKKVAAARDLGLEAVDLEGLLQLESWTSDREWISNGVTLAGAIVKDRATLFKLGTWIEPEGWIVAQVIEPSRWLDKLKSSGAMESFLVDAKGRLVAHPDKEWLLHPPDFSQHEIVRLSGDSPVVMQVKSFRWKDRGWLGAYARIPELGVSVIAQVPESEAYLSGLRFLEKTVLFSILVLTVSLAIALLFSSSLTRPLYDLVAATERVARWDFGATVHISGNDEIGLLARSFNAMAADLQNQQRQLQTTGQEMERKVKERTSSIETEKKQAAVTSDALVRTTRLASLGELAGAAAHEVLNPVNNINIRVERMRMTLKEGEATDLSLLSEIVEAWLKTFKAGGFEALRQQLEQKTGDGKRLLIEEDLENLSGIARDAVERNKERLSDADFFTKEISRITKIVNNMRSLSRVGGERRPVDVHVPLEETLVNLSDLFERKGVSVAKDFGAETRDQYTVIADKDELVQVFINLVRNGVHAIGQANRRAAVLRVSTLRKKDRIEIRIQDNGSGISKEHVGRLFEPNFTTKSLEEGTGLGLSISRRLVRAFGGDIELESTQEGEGTTFLIWFPVTS